MGAAHTRTRARAHTQTAASESATDTVRDVQVQVSTAGACQQQQQTEDFMTHTRHLVAVFVLSHTHFAKHSTTMVTHTHTHTHTLVVYNTVQYKQWVHTWSICQSNLQILQRRLQHRPVSDTDTPNTQQHTDRTHSATGARGSLQPGFNQVIPLHRRAPWCDVSLTSLTSWRGKPLHQGSSRSVHAAQRYKLYYAASRCAACHGLPREWHLSTDSDIKVTHTQTRHTQCTVQPAAGSSWCQQPLFSSILVLHGCPI